VIAVSIGCPAGVGPEVSVAAAARLSRVARVLVGDADTILAAAKLAGIPERRFAPWGGSWSAGRIGLLEAGPRLTPADRHPGKPSRRAGAAQLAWIDAAYDFASATGAALVTGPVSKAAIARSGAPGAGRFRGHTEWLLERDGARSAVMCFVAPKLATSLVTTHLPLAEVPQRITSGAVADAAVALAELLGRLGVRRPRIAVASLNPHAGESELFGAEERRAILPGIRAAARRLGGRGRVIGPIGAETAYRLTRAGEHDGVVAMYHNQATIPTKLVAFGSAVNVTMGLSIVRTSVDHGTGYDIAWRGRADARGMLAAMRLGQRLLAGSSDRRILRPR
jgi:4-hydroxythreonine-4-phosphate dehydrogenase